MSVQIPGDSLNAVNVLSAKPSPNEHEYQRSVDKTTDSEDISMGQTPAFPTTIEAASTSVVNDVLDKECPASQLNEGPVCMSRVEMHHDPTVKPHRGAQDQTVPQADPRNDGKKVDAAGWDTIEERIYEQDAGMMETHADDMDALLVFAGLFSAVLTSFVVQTYPMLQPDNTQLTVDLLMRISAQLGSLSVNGQFVNSTVPPMTSLPPSPTSGATRAVNILWFLSLVFSLSAALFGILVKHWIREYLEWKFILAVPSYNIMIRQLRFEAWNRWNVPAVIAMIPALLEVSLVLFMAGLIVLLWTLDVVVAIVITIATGIFLALASVVTVMPAFARHCPYKSPTGWAFTKVWDFICSIARVAMEPICLRGSRTDLRSPLFRSYDGWRQREVQVDLVQDEAVFRKALHVPSSKFTASGSSSDTGSLDQRHRDISNLSFAWTSAVIPIQQALLWSQRAFQETQIGPDVADCLDHLSLQFSRLGSETPAKLLPAQTFFHLVWALAPTLHKKHNGIGRPLCIQLAEQSYSMKSVDQGAVIMLESRKPSNDVATALASVDVEAYAVLSQLCIRLLRVMWAPEQDLGYEWRQAFDALFFVRGLLQSRSPAQFAFFDIYRGNYDDFVSRYSDLLLEIYHRPHKEYRHGDFRTSLGVKTSVLLLLCEQGYVDSVDHGNVTIDRHRDMDAEGYAKLATYLRECATPKQINSDKIRSVFEPADGSGPLFSQNAAYPSEALEAKHSFVMVADMALRTVGDIAKGTISMSPGTGDAFKTLLLDMIDVVKESAVPREDFNCGCLVDLPWITTLTVFDNATAKRLIHMGLREELIELVSVLRSSLDASLITGEDNRNSLPKLQNIVALAKGEGHDCHAEPQGATPPKLELSEKAPYSALLSTSSTPSSVEVLEEKGSAMTN